MICLKEVMHTWENWGLFPLFFKVSSYSQKASSFSKTVPLLLSILPTLVDTYDYITLIQKNLVID